MVRQRRGVERQSIELKVEITIPFFWRSTMRVHPLMVLAISTLIVGVSLLTADAKQEVLKLEEELGAAILRSDTAKLGHILADEWEVIIPTE
jgi:hypothetical protein